jgi:hypothetical protein
MGISRISIKEEALPVPARLLLLKKFLKEAKQVLKLFPCATSKNNQKHKLYRTS